MYSSQEFGAAYPKPIVRFYYLDLPTIRVCLTKTPSSGFPSNVTLLLPGRLLNPASSSLPHVADFNGIRHGWDLRDPQSWIYPLL